MSRRLIPYVDMDEAYARPVDGGVGSAGWFRQASHNLELMWCATAIGGGPNDNLGAVEFLPSWVDLTLYTGAGEASQGGYVQVGHICYLWAGCWLESMGSAGLGVALPVAPADTLLPMVGGQASLYTLDGSDFAMAPAVIEESNLMFYNSNGGGRLVQGAYPVDTYELSVFAVYRCAEPAVGRLNGFTTKITDQYPVYSL